MKAIGLVAISVALAVLTGYSVAFLLGGGGSRPPIATDSTGVQDSLTPTPAAPNPSASSAATVVAAVPEQTATPALTFEVSASPATSPATASIAATPVPATATAVPATATAVPPTATAVPATATAVPATATAVPATATAVPPTAAPATPVPATATAVPPTATAVPATATPRPAASPTGTPPPPVAAQPEVFVEDTFDSPATGWPVRTSGDWLANYEEGQYRNRLTGDKEAGVAYPMKDGNYRIAVDVAVESGAAGMVFLYSQPSSYYWTGIGADGTFGIERIDGDTVTPVVEWAPQTAAPDKGRPARLIVERQGPLMMVSIGNAHIAHIEVPEGNWENRYGFVIKPRDGIAVAAFDNLYGERFP